MPHPELAWLYVSTGVAVALVVAISGVAFYVNRMNDRLREEATRRIGSEAALLESEWTFRALFEKSPIGVAYLEMIYDATGAPTDYRFLDANAHYREMTGVDPRDKSARQAFPGIENDPADWLGTSGRVARTGESVLVQLRLQPNGR